VDEKSNEITAIPLLLAVLEIPGCVVTICPTRQNLSEGDIAPD
jgi:hypothetical protein